jgi:hypothetical protein
VTKRELKIQELPSQRNEKTEYGDDFINEPGVGKAYTTTKVKSRVLSDYRFKQQKSPQMSPHSKKSHQKHPTQAASSRQHSPMRDDVKLLSEPARGEASTPLPKRSVTPQIGIRIEDQSTYKVREYEEVPVARQHYVAQKSKKVSQPLDMSYFSTMVNHQVSIDPNHMNPKALVAKRKQPLSKKLNDVLDNLNKYYLKDNDYSRP